MNLTYLFQALVVELVFAVFLVLISVGSVIFRSSSYMDWEDVEFHNFFLSYSNQKKNWVKKPSVYMSADICSLLITTLTMVLFYHPRFLIQQLLSNYPYTGTNWRITGHYLLRSKYLEFVWLANKNNPCPALLNPRCSILSSISKNDPCQLDIIKYTVLNLDQLLRLLPHVQTAKSGPLIDVL